VPHGINQRHFFGLTFIADFRQRTMQQCREVVETILSVQKKRDTLPSPHYDVISQYLPLITAPPVVEKFFVTESLLLSVSV
jgi:hypothetical protein